MDNPARTARFGVFELELRTGELRRGGVRVKLQDQPFRLLVFLLEHAGDVVTREELQQRLWPSDFVDFDHSLNTAIRKLRAALDDTADNPRFIETLARRGYRFIAPVSWEGGTQTPPIQPPAVSTAVTTATAAPRWRVIGAGLLLLAVLTAAFFGYRSRTSSTPVNAVAVLPFANADMTTQHISDGLTEILIDTISRVPDLRVMARTTAFRHKGKDPRQAGQDLGVGAVVTGNVQPETGGLRIHVELIDVEDGTQLWGRQYHATAATLAATQGRISGDLTHELRAGLDREQRTALARSLTRSAEAYDLYLKGLYRWNQRGDRNVRASLDLFHQAVAADPGFAAAHAGIANAYGVLVGTGALPVQTGAPLVVAAARRTLELDPNNAEAYVSLATTSYRNVWDFSAAERHYRKALELNPNYATGHQWFADFLRSMGRFEEARRETDMAYRLDPLSMPVAVTTCLSFYMERRYEEAVEFARRVEQAEPQLAMPFCSSRALIALGRYDRAFDLSAPTDPEGENLHDRYLAAFRSGGIRAVYETRLSMMLATQSRFVPVDIAAALAMLGRKDEAFAWLEKGFHARVSRLTNINIDPELDPLRSDPRFDDLLRRIGLPKVNPARPLRPVT